LYRNLTGFGPKFEFLDNFLPKFKFFKNLEKIPKFSRFCLVIILPVPTKMGKIWTKSDFLGKIQISIIGLRYCSLCRCSRGQVLDFWTGDGHCFSEPISSNFAPKQANKFFYVFCNNYEEIWCLMQKQVQPVVIYKIVTNMWCYMLVHGPKAPAEVQLLSPSRLAGVRPLVLLKKSPRHRLNAKLFVQVLPYIFDQNFLRLSCRSSVHYLYLKHNCDGVHKKLPVDFSSNVVMFFCLKSTIIKYNLQTSTSINYTK
jgi:hypothetical protein